MNKIDFYNGNKLLKSSGVNIEFTSEQVDEWIKCSTDPIYFINNYVKVVHVDKGVVPFALFPYQERIINAYHNNRKCVVMTSRQSGKCCLDNSVLNIQNKKTGEIISITIGEFHEMCKMQRDI